MNGYPCWRYHKDHQAVIVKDPEAMAKLGPGWVDSPDRVNDEVEEKHEEKPEEKPEDQPDPIVAAQVQRRRRGPNKVRK